MKGVDKVVLFGLQYFIKKYLISEFNNTFFSVPKDVAVSAYIRRMDNYLGKGSIDPSHIAALHDLGYIPVEIKAVPEGNAIDLRVPMLTIKNTHPEFFWITNYIETMLSCVLWQPCTSATIALEYRKLLEYYANETGGDLAFVKWQGHDFSFRGMAGIESAQLSGAAHLLSFNGTDTIPAIDFLEEYYNANSDVEIIGGSVPATEHSVMCAGGQQDEFDTFKRLITELYPSGVVSIVSDTWDFWQVVTEFLPKLKDEIVKRNGKVVIRPDSGDPVDIICGTARYSDREAYEIDRIDPNESTRNRTPESKGLIECLWDTFGGTINDKGYKVLDSHIGAIYGDSITLDRAREICKRLKDKGFASTNIVFGIGSFTYQYNTRDTFGFAMKATYVEVDNIGRPIFKNPKTDDGTKRSAKGLLSVERRGTTYKLHDELDWTGEQQGSLSTVFKNGVLYKDWSLSSIRGRLNNFV